MSFVDWVVTGAWLFMGIVVVQTADRFFKKNGLDFGAKFKNLRGSLHHSRISQPEINMIQTVHGFKIRIPATVHFISDREIVIDKEGSD